MTSTDTLTTEELTAVCDKTKAAQVIYSSFTQEKVDEIFRVAAEAASAHCEELAEKAIAETGMGVYEDKVSKNKFASEYIYQQYKDTKTVGVVQDDPVHGSKTIADPVGLIAAVIPCTNPTSTSIFKCLLALKTRNGIVISPHPRAKKCTVLAAKIVYDAALSVGAPPDIINWIENPTIPLTDCLMNHPDVQLILATGGPGMVKAAYSSGKPALGVGSGNVPAIIDETADIPKAVSSIVKSKSYDNGMICASEQSVLIVESVYDTFKEELQKQGGYFTTEEEATKLGTILLKNGFVNPIIVGQPPQKIATLAGFSVPDSARIIVCEQTDATSANPFAHEKLSPVLAVFKAQTFESAVDTAIQIVSIGGLGHTSVLHTNATNQERIEYFGIKMPTGRLLINSPSSQGAIGLCNSEIIPSLTLGCGSWGGNSSSENIGIKNLLNYKTVALNKEFIKLE